MFDICYIDEQLEQIIFWIMKWMAWNPVYMSENINIDYIAIAKISA